MREHGPAFVRAREDGFSLIELLVVLVIISILMAAVLPSIRNARKAPDGPGLEVAASSLWRASMRYRADHRGTFPPTSALTGPSSQSSVTGASSQLKSTLKSPAGEPYLTKFPSMPTNSQVPVPVRTSSAGATGSPYLVYSSSGFTGRLEAYDANGKRRWCRAVSSVGTAQFENGGGGRIAC